MRVGGEEQTDAEDPEHGVRKMAPALKWSDGPAGCAPLRSGVERFGDRPTGSTTTGSPGSDSESGTPAMAMLRDQARRELGKNISAQADSGIDHAHGQSALLGEPRRRSASRPAPATPPRCRSPIACKIGTTAASVCVVERRAMAAAQVTHPPRMMALGEYLSHSHPTSGPSRPMSSRTMEPPPAAAACGHPNFLGSAKTG